MIPLRAARAPLSWLVLTFAATCAVAADTPQDWLDRMNTALTTRNYVGVFSHWESGRVETLRIVHRVVDGAVTERLESLDGSGRQFVRTGTELTCYLPDQRTVLVEKAPPSLMPAGLPKFDSAMTDYYLLQSEGAIRQMGEKAQVISVTPRDGFRYGYRVWIDRSTGMPLKTEMVDTDGNAIEQVVFSSLVIRHHIADQEFVPQVATAGFQWLRDDGAPAVIPEVPGPWSVAQLPPGFHLAAQTAQMMPGVPEPVTHLVFSDGVATVSVFVQTETIRNAPNQGHTGVSQVGNSSAFTSVESGRKFVALGEVPPATVRFIIESLMHQSAAQSLGDALGVRLTIVQRQDCELCDQMRAELTALGRREALPPLSLVDVDTDPELQRRHGLHVPVLLLEGTVVCRHRLDSEELLRILRPRGSPSI